MPRLFLLSALFIAAVAGSAFAQEAPGAAPGAKGQPAEAGPEAAGQPAQPAAKPARPASQGDNRVVANLRVRVVISRFREEKKEASLPYTFLVGARSERAGNPVRMRMGVDTPVPVVKYEGGEPKDVGMQYRTVGTNIDCRAFDQKDGSYQLYLTVENSSALAGPGANVSGAPLFRRFETYVEPVMRDGETIHTVASTDPVTGETVKIDITMNVLK